MLQAKRPFRQREICLYKDFRDPGLSTLSLSSDEIRNDCKLLLKDYRNPDIVENAVNERIRKVASDPVQEEASLMRKSYDFIFGYSPSAEEF